MANKQILFKYSDHNRQIKTARLGFEGTTSWRNWWRGMIPLYLVSEELYGIVAAGEQLGGIGLILQYEEMDIVYSTNGKGGVQRKYTMTLLGEHEEGFSKFLFKPKKGLTLTVKSDLDLYSLYPILLFDEVLTKNLRKRRDLQLKEITPEEVLKAFPTVTLIGGYLESKLSQVKNLSLDELISHSEVLPLIENLRINEKSEIAGKIRALSQEMKGELVKIGYDGILQKFKGALEPEVTELAKKLEELTTQVEKLGEEISESWNRKKQLEKEAEDLSRTTQKSREEYEQAIRVQREVPEVLERIQKSIKNGKVQLAGLIQGTDQMKEENERLEQLLKKIEGKETKGLDLEKINQFFKNGRTQLAGLVLATNHIGEENERLKKLLNEAFGEENE